MNESNNRAPADTPKDADQLTHPQDRAAVEANDPGGAHAKGYTADPPAERPSEQREGGGNAP